MIKKTIKYTNFMDQPKEEILCFHMSETDVLDINKKYNGDFKSEMEKYMLDDKPDAFYGVIKDFVLSAYGKISEDGNRFEKSDKITKEFESSICFNELLMELLTNEEEITAFILGVVPKKVAMRLKEELSIVSPSDNRTDQAGGPELEKKVEISLEDYLKFTGRNNVENKNM